MQVKYWQRNSDQATDSLILLKSSLEPWALVVGLQPFTEYYVRVMAYNSAGSGQESERYLGQCSRQPAAQQSQRKATSACS